jgi:Ras family
LQALAEYHQIPFLETSAKTGLNVEEAFTVISQLIYDKIKVSTTSTIREYAAVLRNRAIFSAAWVSE